MKQIKHLIVDIGGVLAKKCGAAAVAGVTEKNFDLWISFNKLDELANKGEIKFSEYLRKFNQLAGTHYNFTQFEEARIKIIKFNTSLIQYCKKNRKRFKTSILADNNWEMDRFYNRYIKLDKWTHHRIYSYRYKITKPNPKIYKLLLKKLEAKPQECLFIDNYPENIKAAKKLGFQTILYKNNRQLFLSLTRYFWDQS